MDSGQWLWVQDQDMMDFLLIIWDKDREKWYGQMELLMKDHGNMDSLMVLEKLIIEIIKK